MAPLFWEKFVKALKTIKPEGVGHIDLYDYDGNLSTIEYGPGVNIEIIVSEIEDEESDAYAVIITPKEDLLGWVKLLTEQFYTIVEDVAISIDEQSLYIYITEFSPTLDITFFTGMYRKISGEEPFGEIDFEDLLDDPRWKEFISTKKEDCIKLYAEYKESQQLCYGEELKNDELFQYLV